QDPSPLAFCHANPPETISSGQPPRAIAAVAAIMPCAPSVQRRSSRWTRLRLPFVDPATVTASSFQSP
ncbi:hypothetical protein, partial [Ralstonia solanacearum]|uniref:hypothetical protein n=1 Tax=Ralstonia solanacearum TaxID=305 RepID=UPI001E29AF6E